jgi:siroheme synthase
VLRVGVYAATFGVNFPDKAAACAAAGVTIQTVPGLAAASAAGAGHVDLRCRRVVCPVFACRAYWLLLPCALMC